MFRQLVILLLGTAVTHAADFRKTIEPLLSEHCYDCHDDVTSEAGLDLFTLEFDPGDPQNLATWTHVRDRVLAGEMPPAKKPRPAPQLVAVLEDSSHAALNAAWKKRYSDSGRTAYRRLNPVEYENTLRDLLDAPWLQLKDMLPPDPEKHGFDNVSEAQEISYVQMARYLEAAEAAIDSAMMLRPPPDPQNIRTWFTEKGRYLGKGKFEGLGNGDVRPVDEWTVLMRNPNSAQAPWRIDKQKRNEPGWYRFRARTKALYYDKGKLLPPRRGHVAAIYTAAKRLLGKWDVPEDGSVIEFTAWMHEDDRLEFHCLSLDDRNFPNRIQNPIAPYEAPGIGVEYFEIDGPFPTADCEPDAAKRQWPPESYRRLFGDLPTAPWTETTGLHPPQLLHLPDLSANKFGLRDAYQVPIDNYMVVSKDPKADAERLLRDFLQRAYRRPPEESEVQRCLAFALEGIEAKLCFQDAMRPAFKAALCSPDFLYLQEEAGNLDDHALASRVSYLLWRSTPDQTLLAAADDGKLRTNDGFLAQFHRLLDDPRSHRFAEDFTGQWLELRKIHDTQPDRYLFPEYFCDTHAVDSAVEETITTFAAMLRDDLPAITAVDADFAFVNERLAEIYDIPGVHGKDLRRVSLPANSPRGGFLTQSAVLKVTANGLTTSPVIRGTWILEHILGREPPAPPPDAGAIEPDTRGATTIRELLAQHSREESCAVCHKDIDPPGFALENFDVMGAWRDRYRSFDEGDPVSLKIANRQVKYKLGLPVDASGETPDGYAFQNIHDYRELLLKDREQIARNLVERLLTFATGAGPTYRDRALIESILEKTAPAHGLQSILTEIVLSDAFQRK